MKRRQEEEEEEEEEEEGVELDAADEDRDDDANDDGGSDEDEQKERQADTQPKQKKARIRSNFIDDAAEVEGDDDEEEEEEEEGEPRKRQGDAQAKQKKARVRNFIDDVAEVEDDDDDEDDEDEGEPDEYEPDEEAEEIGDKDAELENRRYDAERSQEEYEKMAEAVKARFDGHDARQRYDDDDDYGTNRFQILPDATKDPRLWCIRCKPGHEKMLVIQLMQKSLDSQHTEKPLQISSALCTDFKGYIYIEAYKEAHVREATQGLNNLFYRIEQVKVGEMTDVMRIRVAEKKTALTRGSWVRMRGGERNEYRDDLAQVIEVDNDGARATVRLIPRLKIYLQNADGEQSDRIRPQARLFRPEEVQRLGGDVTGPHLASGGREFFMFDNQKFEDGCLIKDVSTRNLRWDDTVVPTLAELERFKAGLGGDADMELLQAVNMPRAGVATFNVGDIVKVVDGDLKHLKGVVQSVAPGGGTVTILPQHEALTEPLSFPAELLQKYFKMGDHVKVVGGSRHIGETGIVVRVGRAETEADKKAAGTSESLLYIFSDLTQNEIIVASAFVQECSEVSAGLERLGNYDLHDMVMLDRTQVGVIVKVEHSSFKVLTTSNAVQTIELQRMGRKKLSKGVVALDQVDQKIEVGTPLMVVEGQYMQRIGVVKHIFKAYVFIYSMDVKENTGIVCVRARQCRLCDKTAKPTMQGFEAVGSSAPELSRASFVPQSPSQLMAGMGMGPPMGGAMGGAMMVGGKGGGKGAKGGGKGKGGKGQRDELIGQTVRMTKGAWKGYHGTVKTTNETSARVELHGKQKVVSVARDSLFKMNLNPASRQSAAPSFSGGGEYVSQSARGWDDGSQTPLHESVGLRTPLRDDGFRTPMHGLDDWYSAGSRTPLLDGSRTPMHDGSRTPLHDAFAPMTPMHDGVWGSGGTPAHRPTTPSATDGFADGGFESAWGAMDEPAFAAQSPYAGLTPGTVGTPGFNPGSTPFGESPFLAATPDAGYSPMLPRTPGQPSTPGQPDTPGQPGTPGQPSTPGGPSTPNTPGSHWTPMADNPYEPGTPGAFDTERYPDGILVEVTNQNNRKAKIVEVLDDSYTVQFLDQPVNAIVQHKDLALVRPVKKDRVVIIKGIERNSFGTLIGIDGTDGIIKLQANLDIKILDLNLCAKLAD